MIQLAMSTRGFATDELSKAAALAKQAGIRQLEIPVATPADEQEARRTKQRLMDAGVEAAACAVGLDFSPAGRKGMAGVLEQSLAYAGALGAGLLNLYCGPSPDTKRRDAQKALVAAVASVVDSAARRGTVIVLENELSAKPNIAESVDSWIETARRVSSDSFGLTLDLANFVASGEERISDKLEAAWPLVGHVHLKDLASCDEPPAATHPERQVFQGRHGRFVPVPVGSGIVDNVRVMQQLLKLRYSGTVTIECFFDLASLRAAVESVRRASGDRPAC